MSFIVDIFGGSSTEVTFPQPTAAEAALQTEQTALLRQQRDILTQQLKQQELLMPILFEAAGIIPQFDEQGNITGFERTPDPLADLRGEVEEGLLERSLAALSGNLPVSPALERELKLGKETLEERLRKNLGPGFATSSPGIESLGAFEERAFNVRESARRGDLTLAEQLGVARTGSNQALIDQFLGRAVGINSQGFQTAGAFGQAAGNFGQAIGGFRANRGLQLQGNIAQAQAQAELLSAIFGAVGLAGGLAFA